MFWIYARFVEFFATADSVTRIIYAWRIIPHKKLFQNELRLANRSLIIDWLLIANGLIIAG